MTWFLVFITVSVGFAEYSCAHYLLQNAYKYSENRAHLLLAILILVMITLPKKIIWGAFIFTLFFIPLIFWVSINIWRSGK